MTSYIALVRKDLDSDYGAEFPDFPGCITAGKDLDEVETLAQEALQLHIEGMIEDGKPLPQPSRLEDIMSRSENRQAIALLVTVRDQV